MGESGLGNQCWFCQKEKPGEIVPLNVTLKKKEADQKLSKLVAVPSCPKCNANHRKFARAQTWYTLIGFMFLLAAWVVVIINDVKTNQLWVIFIIPLTFLVFFFYTSFLDKVYLDRMKKQGTEPQSHLNKHHEVEALIDQGWRVQSSKTVE